MDYEKDFNTGFNQGYILSKYSKDVAHTISKSLQNENEYTQGFYGGVKEAELELNKTKINELKDLRINKNKDLGLER